MPVLAILCGMLVGFTLGLIGGGGSIMATPLLLYVVGLPPHQAIGTGALAVSTNAFVNFIAHARVGNVRWRSAAAFAVIGTIGAALGSALGKHFDGDKLLFLFALLMIVVGISMLRRGGAQRIEASAHARPALVTGCAMSVGLLAGFFGIGGGFLIVPGLLLSTGMAMIDAVGSSLLSVGSFGLTVAVNYALSGLVVWKVALEYIGGGVLGGLIGMSLACRLAHQRTALTRIFASFVFIVAFYMLYRNAAAFGFQV